MYPSTPVDGGTLGPVSRGGLLFRRLFGCGGGGGVDLAAFLFESLRSRRSLLLSLDDLLVQTLPFLRNHHLLQLSLFVGRLEVDFPAIVAFWGSGTDCHLFHPLLLRQRFMFGFLLRRQSRPLQSGRIFIIRRLLVSITFHFGLTFLFIFSFFVLDAITVFLVLFFFLPSTFPADSALEFQKIPLLRWDIIAFPLLHEGAQMRRKRISGEVRFGREKQTCVHAVENPLRLQVGS